MCRLASILLENKKVDYFQIASSVLENFDFYHDKKVESNQPAKI